MKFALLYKFARRGSARRGVCHQQAVAESDEKLSWQLGKVESLVCCACPLHDPGYAIHTQAKKFAEGIPFAPKHPVSYSPIRPNTMRRPPLETIVLMLMILDFLLRFDLVT